MTALEKWKNDFKEFISELSIPRDDYKGIMAYIDEVPNEALEQKPRKGEWLRMSNLSEQEDDRYKCSRCGNVVHYRDKINLYTFNSWCGRCGSDNGRKIEVSE